MLYFPIRFDLPTYEFVGTQIGVSRKTVNI